MYHVYLASQCIYECSDERGEYGDGEEWREWGLHGRLYADDVVLCSELEEDLRVGSATIYLVNGRGLQLECARVLHELLLVPALTYGGETMIWKEKEKSRIMVVQMYNLRGLLGIRRLKSRMHG